MDAQRDLPGFLALPFAELGSGVSVGVDGASVAQPDGADEEGGAHEELLINWFRAKGEVSSGAVEGLNNKIRVVTRRSYGFRTFDAMEKALYHTLGRLPEPESTHRFC